MKKGLSLVSFLAVNFLCLPVIAIAQNVGIGTFTPQTNLHVIGSNQPTIRVETNTAPFSVDANLELKTVNGVYDHLILKKSVTGASGFIDNVPISNTSSILSGAHAGPMLLGVINDNPLHFFTNALERMRITNDGFVSIGTRNSPGKLSLLHNSAANSPTIDLKEDGLDYARINFGSNQNSSKYWAIAGLGTPTTANDRMNFWYSTYGDIMTLTGTGQVGVGKVPSSGGFSDAVLQVKGQSNNDQFRMESSDGSKYWSYYIANSSTPSLQLNYNSIIRGSFDHVSGNYMPVSDRRMKKDVQPLANTLQAIKKLQPYTYRYNYNADNDRHTYGFMAQDIQQAFPELVKEIEQRDGSKLLTVDYTGLHAVTLKAVQEQQLQIEKLSTLVQELQQEIKLLKNK